MRKDGLRGEDLTSEADQGAFAASSWARSDQQRTREVKLWEGKGPGRWCWGIAGLQVLKTV